MKYPDITESEANTAFDEIYSRSDMNGVSVAVAVQAVAKKIRPGKKKKKAEKECMVSEEDMLKYLTEAELPSDAYTTKAG